MVNNQVTDKISARRMDPEAQVLAAYFTKYNSPLASHAQDFVDAAKMYGLDWRLVAAISGVESTFGKQSYGFNAWGWGIYGDQTLDFQSWKAGIYTVSEGLRQNYVNKGLTNPYLMNRIYAASPSWGGKVTYFMADMERFASGYQFTPTVAGNTFNPKIAADSGQLALR